MDNREKEIVVTRRELLDSALFLIVIESIKGITTVKWPIHAKSLPTACNSKSPVLFANSQLITVFVRYAFLSENFRKAFHRVISCNRLSKRANELTTDNRVEQELTIGMCQKQSLDGNDGV